MKGYSSQYFIQKLKKLQLTEEDHLALIEWLKYAPDNDVAHLLDEFETYFENHPDELYPENGPLLANLMSKIEVADSTRNLRFPNKKKLITWSLSVAASLLILFFIGLGLQVNKRQQIHPSFARILPGGNKAFLRLSNGEILDLQIKAGGQIAAENGVRIYKQAKGRLYYQSFQASSGATVAKGDELNVLYTPRGGDYEVVLADGTKVWLNAASSLSFPAHFSGRDRRVKLVGEAYFEVAKDKKHPFKVDVNHTSVQVLGTHFNIYGYSDESAVKTTLLEGSVQISEGRQQKIITPGEQAISGNEILVQKINVNEVLEWKNGNFNFSHEKIDEIMRKIARWYDVSIEYSGRKSRATFVGSIPRSRDIKEVLKYLELTDMVHFQIRERRIIVMP